MKAKMLRALAFSLRSAALQPWELGQMMWSFLSLSFLISRGEWPHQLAGGKTYAVRVLWEVDRKACLFQRQNPCTHLLFGEVSQSTTGGL